MNTLVRRLSGAFLALVLIAVPAAAAHGEPMTAPLDRWTHSLASLLDAVLDGLTSAFAASETGDPDGDAVQLEDDGGNELAPRWDPNGASSELTTTTQLAPRWDPNG